LPAATRNPPAVPALAWGSLENLVVHADGSRSCDYLPETDHGLYSNVSTAMEDVITLHRHGIAVTRVNLSRGFRSFKDAPDADVYPSFFAGIGDGLARACRRVAFDAWDVHKPYRDLPLAARLFPPSAEVRACMAEMSRDSGIQPLRSLALVYRGTDKGTEVTLAPVDAYIAAARSILARHPDLDVVVQTDQAQVRKAVAAAFGARCRFFAALPVTHGDTAIHNLAFGVEVLMPRAVFAQRMMAAALLLSRCAHVVTHTGNVGAWIAIYRGSAHGLHQFDRAGALLAPYSAPSRAVRAISARVRTAWQARAAAASGPSTHAAPD
jgi:hypothetical protein